MSTILAIEGGGSGYRAAKVQGKDITIIATLPIESLMTPRQLIEFIRSNATEIGADAVGISTSGFVNWEGNIEHSPNTGLPPHFPITRLVHDAYDRPVATVNDLVAATRGISEIFTDLQRFAVENLGGGDGQNEYDHGKIKPIDERGHMVLDTSPFALPCGCGLYGCYETILGGRALARLVNLTLATKNLTPPDPNKPLAFLDQEYRTDASWAQRIYDQFCLALGQKLAMIQLGGKFPAFVFRGQTITKALTLAGIEEKIRAAMRDRLPAKDWANVEFRIVPPHPQGVKDWDGFLGAAAFAEDALKAAS